MSHGLGSCSCHPLHHDLPCLTRSCQMTVALLLPRQSSHPRRPVPCNSKVQNTFPNENRAHSAAAPRAGCSKDGFIYHSRASGNTTSDIDGALPCARESLRRLDDGGRAESDRISRAQFKIKKRNREKKSFVTSSSDSSSHKHHIKHLADQSSKDCSETNTMEVVPFAPPLRGSPSKNYACESLQFLLLGVCMGTYILAPLDAFYTSPCTLPSCNCV